jgi:hypothetical protein
MTIKLKDLAVQSPAKENRKTREDGKELFRQFVSDATSLRYRDEPFWEEFRQRNTPSKFKTVPQMFARWQELAGIKK